MRLQDIAGQELAVTVLRRALGADRLAHAYLFDGPAGVGKRSTAVGLGLALLCPTAPGEGCGSCLVCRRALGHNHPDLLVFDATGLPDKAKAAGAKSAVQYVARQVFPYALQAPHESPARLLVIDQADEMSADVQNTLLKTLEEPRRSVHIVLVSAAPDRLLPTILSRTQRVRFVPVRPAVLQELAGRHRLPPERAATAVALAGGSVARLLASGNDEAEPPPWAAVAELRRAAAAPDMGSIFDTAAALGEKQAKERLPDTLTLLCGFYRDVLVSAAGAPELALLADRREEIDALAGATGTTGRPGLRDVLRALRAAIEAERMPPGTNAPTALERMLVEMRPCERRAGR